MPIDWKPLEADYLASTFSLEFAYFNEFVLKHAIDAIAAKLISEDDVGSHNLRVSLALGMLQRQLALSIQALWEANFRKWVRACVSEIVGDDSHAKDIKRKPLSQVENMLIALRGKSMSDISGGDLLKQALLVGNVVRHGDGPSAAKLAKEAPYLWLNDPPELDENAVVSEDCADELSIPEGTLKEYSEAVSSFWAAISQTATDQNCEEPPWAVK